MKKINNYKQIGLYSAERQAIDDILHKFDQDRYNKMYDVLISGQIDNFDDITQKDKFTELAKMNIDIGNYDVAACFLALLSNLNQKL